MATVRVHLRSAETATAIDNDCIVNVNKFLETDENATIEVEKDKTANKFTDFSMNEEDDYMYQIIVSCPGYEKFDYTLKGEKKNFKSITMYLWKNG